MPPAPPTPLADRTLHVVPVRDDVGHDTSGVMPDCVCGPTLKHCTSPDAPDGWIIVHHSLDGREKREQA